MSRSSVAGFSLFDNFSRVSEVTLENRLRPINTNIFKEVPRAPMQNFRSVEGFYQVPARVNNVTVLFYDKTEAIIKWDLVDHNSTELVITANPGGQTVVSPPRFVDKKITGLTPGTTYTFTVTPRLFGVLGPPSIPTNPITTKGVSPLIEEARQAAVKEAEEKPLAPAGTGPGVPTNVIAQLVPLSRRNRNIQGVEDIEITWTPPSSPSPIIAYTIISSTGTSFSVITVAGVRGQTKETIVASPNGGVIPPKIILYGARGTSYTFTVTAINAAGKGLPSPSNSITTGGVSSEMINARNAAIKEVEEKPLAPAGTGPGVPTNISVTNAKGGRGGEITISWTAPSSPSPIIGYTITGFTGLNNATIKTTIIASATGEVLPTTTIVPANIGTSYTFTVTAINASGKGPPSLPSSSIVVLSDYGIQVRDKKEEEAERQAAQARLLEQQIKEREDRETGIPNPPQIGLAMRDWEEDQAIILEITPNYQSRKFPITKYTITSNPDGITKIVKARSDGTLPTKIKFDGLTNDTLYTFTATSTTSVATSDPSRPSNHAFASGARYAGAKGNNKDPYSQKQMRAFNGSPDTTQDGAIDIRWIPPTGLRDSGEKIIEYIITASDGQVKTVNAETVEEEVYMGMLHKKAKFTGLMPGTPYTFRIALKTTYGIHTAAELNQPIITRGTPPGNTNANPVRQSPSPETIAASIAGYKAAMKEAEEKPLSPAGTAPGVPTNVIAQLVPLSQRNPRIQGVEHIGISWTAPSSSSPIIGYTIIPSSPLASIDMGMGVMSGETKQTIVAMPDGGGVPTRITLYGLPGTSYTFTVTAINASGKGLPSSPSNSILTSVQANNSSSGLPGMNTASTAASAASSALAAQQEAARQADAAAAAARDAAAAAARDAAAAAARDAAAAAARDAAAAAARDAAAAAARDAAARDAEREAATQQAIKDAEAAARDAAREASIRDAAREDARQQAIRDAEAAAAVAARDAQIASDAAIEARRRAEEQTAKEDAAREQLAVATRLAQVLPEQPVKIGGRAEEQAAIDAMKAKEAREAAAIATRELELASQAAVQARREAAEKTSREEAAMITTREAQLSLQTVEGRRQPAQQRGNSSSGLPGMNPRSQPSYQEQQRQERQERQERQDREDRQYRRQDRKQDLQQQKQRAQQQEQQGNLTKYYETSLVDTPVEDISGVKSPQQTSTKKELTLSETLLSYDKYIIITLLVTSLVLGTIFIGVLSSAKQRI